MAYLVAGEFLCLLTEMTGATLLDARRVELPERRRACGSKVNHRPFVGLAAIASTSLDGCSDGIGHLAKLVLANSWLAVRRVFRVLHHVEQ